MGSDGYAAVYFGAQLSEKEVMALFGAKYEKQIRETCQKDNTPNPRKNNFCGKCGADLRYNVKIAEGIENIADYYELDDILNKLGLEVNAIDKESDEGIESIIIGKQLAESTAIFETGGEVIPIDEVTEDMRKDIEQKLAKLRINKPLKTYLVTSL